MDKKVKADEEEIMGVKGFKHSEETKRKLSVINTGKKHSEESKKKISENNCRYWLGKKRSEESRRNMSIAGLGRAVSDEHKRRLRENSAHYWEGKTFSEEHKRKLSGENSSSWKGGITPLNHQIRNSFKYRQWVSDVLTRDDFTCQECGVRGGTLHTHHINEFANILKEYKIKTLEQALACSELWNINNGGTLCEDCHHDLHWGKSE